MPDDEHVAVLGRNAAVRNEWHAKHSATPGLSGAGLRELDWSRSLRDAVLRETNLCQADLFGTHLEGANFFNAVLDGANLAGAFLTEAQFLNCAQLVGTRNWQSALRDESLGCGASIPDPVPSE